MHIATFPVGDCILLYSTNWSLYVLKTSSQHGAKGKKKQPKHIGKAQKHFSNLETKTNSYDIYWIFRFSIIRYYALSLLSIC